MEINKKLIIFLSAFIGFALSALGFILNLGFQRGLLIITIIVPIIILLFFLFQIFLFRKAKSLNPLAIGLSFLSNLLFGISFVLLPDYDFYSASAIFGLYQDMSSTSFTLFEIVAVVFFFLSCFLLAILVIMVYRKKK